MRRCFIALALWFAFAGALAAEPSDETLRYFLSRTPWCVAGRFTSEPAGEANESGLVCYQADVEVSEVLKGTPDGQSKFRVGILRLEKDQADRPPVLASDAKCVLFVRPAGKRVGDGRLLVRRPARPRRGGGAPVRRGREEGGAGGEGEGLIPGPGALTWSSSPTSWPARGKLRLLAGAIYTAELTRVDDKHFRLTKAVRFSGDYEVRDKRLATKGFQGEDASFEWELHAPNQAGVRRPVLCISSLYRRHADPGGGAPSRRWGRTGRQGRSSPTRSRAAEGERRARAGALTDRARPAAGRRMAADAAGRGELRRGVAAGR